MMNIHKTGRIHHSAGQKQTEAHLQSSHLQLIFVSDSSKLGEECIDYLPLDESMLVSPVSIRFTWPNREDRLLENFH